MILDVVFNHSAELDVFGPTLCQREIDKTYRDDGLFGDVPWIYQTLIFSIRLSWSFPSTLILPISGKLIKP